MKILLLGLSGSGKSTLAPVLAKKYNLSVYEADDEVMLINDGIWPDNDEIVDRGFALANEKVLKQDSVVFVSTWLSKKDFARFVESGFKVVVLIAQFQELVNRKIKRDQTTSEKIEIYKQTYKDFIEYIESPEIAKHILIRIDSTNLSTEELAEIVASEFGH